MVTMVIFHGKLLVITYDNQRVHTKMLKHLELLEKNSLRCPWFHALVLDQDMGLSSTRGLGGTVTQARLGKNTWVGQLIPWEIIGSFYNIEICSSSFWCKDLFLQVSDRVWKTGLVLMFSILCLSTLPLVHELGYYRDMIGMLLGYFLMNETNGKLLST